MQQLAELLQYGDREIRNLMCLDSSILPMPFSQGDVLNWRANLGSCVNNVPKSGSRAYELVTSCNTDNLFGTE